MIRSQDSLLLRDGRRLGIAQYGDPAGTPIFFFHGMPGSRLDAHPDAALAERAGARVIILERPGYGLSDPHPGATLLDWARDVAEAADLLGIERFAVVGWSGGGPYALACAHSLPARVTRVGILSGIAPFSEPSVWAALTPLERAWLRTDRSVPRAILPYLYNLLLRGFMRDLERSYERQMRSVCEFDRTMLRCPEIRAALLASGPEAFRQQALGWATDSALFARPWGFSLGEIEVPVRIWHGEADTMVRPASGRYLAQTIPDCQAVFYPGEGHFLWYERWPEILETFVT